MLAYSGGWYPTLNPLGKASFIAVLIAVLCWLVVAAPFKRSTKAHAWLISCVPLVPLAFLLKSKLHFGMYDPLYGWPQRKFASAPDYFADYVLLGIGLLLAWKATKAAFRYPKVLGYVCLAAFALCLAGELAMLRAMYLPLPPDQIALGVAFG